MLWISQIIFSPLVDEGALLIIQDALLKSPGCTFCWLQGLRQALVRAAIKPLHIVWHHTISYDETSYDVIRYLKYRMMSYDGIRNTSISFRFEFVLSFGVQVMLTCTCKVCPGINCPPLGFFRITFWLLNRFWCC